MKYLITGGCGFIGTNFAKQLLKRGDEVLIIDNLSRKGTDFNLQFLQNLADNKQLSFFKADLLEANDLLSQLLPKVDLVYHLAGQVAVTSSVLNPKADFDNNLLATFKLLEAIRQSQHQPGLIYASTNKVYGKLTSVDLLEENQRYNFAKKDLTGINEKQNLDFHSPYGCSKGGADQYVRDYARIYGLKTMVMRQSCIYGEHQLGVEDQGWVAWFVIATLLNKSITVYGNGKQVRDLLWVDDLFEAWDLASQKVEQLAGEVFNIGGGINNTLSLLELIDFLQTEIKTMRQASKAPFKQTNNLDIKISFAPERPGDQKIFISDNSKAEKKLGWAPTTSVAKGLQKLFNWSRNNLEGIRRYE